MTDQFMDSRPTLSVITPVYNGADFVSRCYENLLRQSFTNWEWVVVDDGLTDGTAEIVRKIKDDRVRLFSNKQNKGRGCARNLAVRESRGDWIVVWDVDDLNFPERLESIERARMQNYEFFCSYAVVVNNDLEIKGTRGFHDPSGCLPREFVHPTLALKKDIAEKIKYKITGGVGGPAEDARVIWTLSSKYKGLWLEDALTIYHEGRGINLRKAIDTNNAHLQTIKELKREKMIQVSGKYYFTVLKYIIKIIILNALQINPKLYLHFINLRDYGSLKKEWELSPERIDFIKRQKTS
ncbi:MAG: glycosyltransferase family 2 protein [Deltaproteobacteria bacterium]|nr:glycosyltransferase family 2 protein [Deltaproteobacteria bacterium]